MSQQQGGGKVRGVIAVVGAIVVIIAIRIGVRLIDHAFGLIGLLVFILICVGAWFALKKKRESAQSTAPVYAPAPAPYDQAPSPYDQQNTRSRATRPRADPSRRRSARPSTGTCRRRALRPRRIIPRRNRTTRLHSRTMARRNRITSTRSRVTPRRTSRVTPRSLRIRMRRRATRRPAAVTSSRAISRVGIRSPHRRTTRPSSGDPPHSSTRRPVPDSIRYGPFALRRR
ncbi:hypothetical protein GCM10010198_18170 [Nocardia seriolae]